MEFLDQWFDREFYAIGGGSVLSARWNHRLSTDIDLFFSEKQVPVLQEQSTWEKISSRLTALSESSQITELQVRPNGFAFHSQFGPVSFFGMPRSTQDAVTTELEATTEIATESTAEILFKKIRGRVVNNSEYVARDLYDLIVAQFKDPDSLNYVFNLLAEVERQSLVYDVEKGDANVADFDRILEPRYPELVASYRTFNSIAGEVLAQNISSTTESLFAELSTR